MSREGKLLIITHCYPFCVSAELEFGYKYLGNLYDELLFNIMPGFFILLVVYEWVKTSTKKLSFGERRSLWFFVISFIMFHLYYCMCTVMNAMDNRPWIQEHNDFITYFVIFTFIFYLIYYCFESAHT